MGEQDALFCFLDSLCDWAKMEPERRGVQELASMITTVESLNEFKRYSSKGQGTGGSVKGGGDRDKSPKRDKPFKDKGKDKKSDAARKYSCFLCHEPYRAFECPKKGKLATLV